MSLWCAGRRGDQKVVPEHASFRRTIGGLGYFALAFGAIVGSGWVVVLGDWLHAAGPGGTALGFVAGGATMALVALCYGDLSARFPKAGAELLYTRAAFGRRVGFLVAWYLTLYAVATCAFEAVAFGWLVRTLVPGVALPVVYRVASWPVTWDALALGAAAAIAIGVVHLRGAKSAIALQNAITFGFIAVVGVVIVIGWHAGRRSNLLPLFSGSSATSAALGVLQIFAMSAFFLNGWQVALHAIEERRSDTPVGSAVLWMIFGILVATIFYVAVVGAASKAAPWRGLLSEELPAAAAFRFIGGPALAAIIIATAIFSLLKTWLALAWMASRLLVAQARDDLLPRLLARIEPRSGAPRNAIIFTTLCTLGGMCAGRRALLPIVNMAAICLALSILLCLLALVRLRAKDRQEAPRSVAPLVVVCALVAAAAMIGAAIVSPLIETRGAIPIEWLLLLIWAAVGLALSRFMSRRSRTAVT